MYEEMLKFLENVHDLEAIDLLVLCEQLKNELIANNQYVKENGIKDYDFEKEKECIDDLSNIIDKIKSKIRAQRIKSIIERYNNLSEKEQSRLIDIIDNSLYYMDERNITNIIR